MKKNVLALVTGLLILAGCGGPKVESGSKQNGLYTKYYSSGKISYTVPYKNGKKHGIFKDYDRKSGKVRSETPYRNGKKDGVSKYWNYSGSTGKLNNYGFTHYKNGLEEGESTSYYGDGKLKRKSFYVNGKKEGLVREYFPNGKLLSSSNYTNGKMNGVYKHWYGKTPYGNWGLSESATYVNGVEHGISKNYLPNGKISEITPMVNGKVDGEQKYYENGKLDRTYYWVKGVQKGSKLSASEKRKRAEREKRYSKSLAAGSKSSKKVDCGKDFSTSKHEYRASAAEGKALEAVKRFKANTSSTALVSKAWAEDYCTKSAKKTSLTCGYIGIFVNKCMLGLGVSNGSISVDGL